MRTFRRNSSRRVICPIQSRGLIAIYTANVHELFAIGLACLFQAPLCLTPRTASMADLLASDQECQSGGDQDGFNDQDKGPLWESIHNAFAQERSQYHDRP